MRRNAFYTFPKIFDEPSLNGTKSYPLFAHEWKFIAVFAKIIRVSLMTLQKPTLENLFIIFSFYHQNEIITYILFLKGTRRHDGHILQHFPCGTPPKRRFVPPTYRNGLEKL